MRDDDRERREHERLTLAQPIRTSIAGVPGHVVDASVGGVGIIHYEPALPAGTECRVHFYSQAGAITVTCKVARTGPHQQLVPLGDGAAWHTGMRIVSMDAESDARMRRLLLTVTEH